MAPFVIVGMASTLAFLSGGGGIDLSIAPLMGLVNIVLVTVLFGTTFGSPAARGPDPAGARAPWSARSTA